MYDVKFAKKINIVVQIIELQNPCFTVKAVDERDIVIELREELAVVFREFFGIKLSVNELIYLIDFPARWEYDREYSLLLGGGDYETFSYKLEINPV